MCRWCLGCGVSPWQGCPLGELVVPKPHGAIQEGRMALSSNSAAGARGHELGWPRQPCNLQGLVPCVGHLGLFGNIGPCPGRGSTLEQLPSKAVAPSHQQRPTAVYSFPFPLLIHGGDCAKKHQPWNQTKGEGPDKWVSLKNKRKVAFCGVTAVWL